MSLMQVCITVGVLRHRYSQRLLQAVCVVWVFNLMRHSNPFWRQGRKERGDER